MSDSDRRRCTISPIGHHRLIRDSINRRYVCDLCGLEIDDRLIAMQKRPERTGLRETP